MGAAAPAGLDGVSIAPTLLGEKPQPQHAHLYWETGAGGHQAVRLGEWKGIRLGVAKNAVVPVQLFHISEDIGETTDVASSHPEIVKKIEAIMRAEHIPSAEFPMGALDAR